MDRSPRSFSYGFFSILGNIWSGIKGRKDRVRSTWYESVMIETHGNNCQNYIFLSIFISIHSKIKDFKFIKMAYPFFTELINFFKLFKLFIMKLFKLFIVIKNNNNIFKKSANIIFTSKNILINKLIKISIKIDLHTRYISSSFSHFFR